MKEFLIKADTDEAKEAFVTFVSNYKVNIGQFMNELIKAKGNPVDAEVKVEKDEITVYQLSPDKGFVIGELNAEAELPVQIMQYKELKDFKRYLVQENDRIILYWKRPTGTPDVKLGQFKTISDSIVGFNSDGVQAAMKAVEQMETPHMKEIKRKQKAGKELTDVEKEQLKLQAAKAEAAE